MSRIQRSTPHRIGVSVIALLALASTATAGGPRRFEIRDALLVPRVLVAPRDGGRSDSGLDRSLAEALFETRSVEVVLPADRENASLGSSSSARVLTAFATRLGRAQAAQFVLLFREDRASRGRPGIPDGRHRADEGASGRGASYSDREVRLDLWLVDAAARTTVATATVTGQIVDEAWPREGDPRGRFHGRYRRPSACELAAQWAAGQVRSRSWRGFVVHAEGDEVCLAAGLDSGVEPGMLFEVCAVRVLLPGTLRTVPRWARRTRLVVEEIDDDLAYCRVLDGNRIQAGDVVSPVAEPAR